MVDGGETSTGFDWYAACLATGITGPFSVWALYVLLAPNYLAMGILAGLFLAFVFLGFGKIRIGDAQDGDGGKEGRPTG